MALRTTIKIAVMSAAAFAGAFTLSSCMQNSERQAVAVVPAATTPQYGLFYMDEGKTAKLAYGRANSDDVDLMLQCTKGSHRVELTDGAGYTPSPTLTLVSSGSQTVLKTEKQSGEDGAILVAHADSGAPALQAFRRSGRIDVAYAGKRHGVIAAADERPGVEKFFTACERG